MHNAQGILTHEVYPRRCFLNGMPFTRPECVFRHSMYRHYETLDALRAFSASIFL